MMLQIRRIVAVVVLLLARTVQASAQSVSYLPQSFLSSVSGLWTVAVGVNVVGQPAFDGGKGDSLGVSPILTIGRAGGSAERFRSPRDSSSIALFDDEGLSAGLAGKLKSGRTASSHAELNGLGDVDRTLEAGGFVNISRSTGFGCGPRSARDLAAITVWSPTLPPTRSCRSGSV